MSARVMRNLLRMAMLGLLLVLWALFLRDGDEQPWWFWLWPAVAVWILYQIILAKTRCPECRHDFAWKFRDGWISAILPVRSMITCRYCGHTQRHGGSGGGA